jgi:Zn-dependent peptidase ImmA (M78 family)
VRQRFSLAHELKHVIDHPFIARAYPSLGRRTTQQRGEAMCDYFAACLLMPRPWVKRAWFSRVQQVDALAEMFGVSEQAMTYRLTDLGLLPSTRCNVYFREARDAYEEVVTELIYFRRAAQPEAALEVAS